MPSPKAVDLKTLTHKVPLHRDCISVNQMARLQGTLQRGPLLICICVVCFLHHNVLLQYLLTAFCTQELYTPFSLCTTPLPSMVTTCNLTALNVNGTSNNIILLYIRVQQGSSKSFTTYLNRPYYTILGFNCTKNLVKDMHNIKVSSIWTILNKLTL